MTLYKYVFIKKKDHLDISLTKKKLYICYNLFLFALIFYFFFLSNKRIKRSQIPIYVSNL